MSRGAKVAIVILIVLAVLFVTGVGIGVTRSDDSGSAGPDQSGGWTVWLKKTLIPDNPVGGNDILFSSCFDAGQGQFAILLKSTCNATIRTSDIHVRSLNLVLVQGLKMSIVLASQGNDKFTARGALPTEKKEMQIHNLPVREEGANLTLTCDEAVPQAGSLPQCRVRLGSK